MTTSPSHQPARLQAILTGLIGLLVLVAAGAGVFIPGFYDGIVDPVYAIGTVTADAVSLLSIPLLAACVWLARRGSMAAHLAWIALLAYLGYAYANSAFDRLYTDLFLVYVAIFGLCCMVLVPLIARLDIGQLGEATRQMRLRRLTAGFLVFTGLVLYAIELPILLARIPGGTLSGGTPFMVLDIALVAPLSILAGVWVWQRRPWGTALTAIFLIKAITLMSGFLVADYIDWFAGRLQEPAPTIAFTVIYALVYFFLWNYFSTFRKGKRTI